jgi:hypothetical protein
MIEYYVYYAKKDNRILLDLDEDFRTQGYTSLLPSYQAKFKGEPNTVYIFKDGKFVYNSTTNKFIKVHQVQV